MLLRMQTDNCERGEPHGMAKHAVARAEVATGMVSDSFDGRCDAGQAVIA